MLSFAIFADFTSVAPCEVPEWSSAVEIGPDSFSNFYHRFEVSPEHSIGKTTTHMSYLLINGLGLA